MSPKDPDARRHFAPFFPASELAVGGLLNDLTAILNAERHGDALQSTAEIVLGEVLNNIVPSMPMGRVIKATSS